MQAPVAQLVERRTENPYVGGSIPPLGIENGSCIMQELFLCLFVFSYFFLYLFHYTSHVPSFSYFLSHILSRLLVYEPEKPSCKVSGYFPDFLPLSHDLKKMIFCT